ncbi:MAG: amino acid adenylation domain-containing protein [Pseudomonadota bacterium]
MNKTLTLKDLQATSVDWPGPIEAAVRRWAAGSHRDKVALDGPAGSLTFGELDRVADALAHHLQKAGVDDGQVVAVLADRVAELIPALLGILRAGAIFSVIDKTYPATRILQMLDTVQPVAIIDVGNTPSPEYPARRLTLPGLHTEALRDLLLNEGAIPLAGREVGPDDPACVTFTSGSTGVPKGVVGRQSGLTAFLPWLAETFEIGPGDTVSLLSGLAHDPLQRDIFTAWWTGARVAVPPTDVFDLPGAMGCWLAETEVTVANLTPSMLRLLTFGAGSELPLLRRVFTVGETLRAADVLALRAVAPNAEVINLYGATETQRALAHHRIPPHVTPADPIPLGTASPGMEVLVLRPDSSPADVGETGAVWIKSAYLALGYLNDAAATQAVFQTDLDGDRRYRTGDMGRRLADGSVVFAGRQDRQVNVRGYRVELGEIEAAAERLGNVVSARAVWLEERGQIVLFAIPRGNTLEREVTADLARALPSYMRPARVRDLQTFPLTPNGKVDECALRNAAGGA